MVLMLIVLGLVALVGGAELLVRGSVSVARSLRVSPLIIGLTIVGFGTSTPELSASIGAALKGAPGIAVGNVVGSNIANILLILGIAALITPIATTKSAFVRDGSALVGASVILAVVCLFGVLDRAVGYAFVLLLIGYIYISFRQDRRGNGAAVVHREQAEEIHHRPAATWTAALFIMGGLVGLIGGAWCLVDGAISAARAWEIPEAVIGLTIVAVGTSLPELTTSVVAGLRGHSDVAFGNIVGSNIFNILGILGVTAVITPLEIPSRIAGIDIWLMLGVTLVAVVFSITGWRVSRWEGFVLLCGYVGYMAILFLPL